MHHNLLVFRGKAANHDYFRCNIMLESGCEIICISKAYANKLQLPSERVALRAELWDGTLLPMERGSEVLNIKIGNAEIMIRPYIVDLTSYDIILGKSWLATHNPHIDWRKNCMLLNLNGKNYTLDAEAPEQRVSRPRDLLSSKQIVRIARKNQSYLYHVVVKPAGKDEAVNASAEPAKQTPELKKVLNEFKDVFPDELPDGLPPERTVQMRIELESETHPKMGPIYKLSRAELGELKRQVNELLSKGLIRPSISP